ncbi:hypothetical protein JCM17845_16980 [Iodidimonas gelatinilytica]|uniref:Uncharacterized protein n=1 Tax=Iodidimonas gelatinilytica TaxID=1236966 RepID=A0A5A7N064_9PROT|nr:hypothetical protein JCM17845_16980 [Iodidimonas gelatinilytica]
MQALYQQRFLVLLAPMDDKARWEQARFGEPRRKPTGHIATTQPNRMVKQASNRGSNRSDASSKSLEAA